MKKLLIITMMFLSLASIAQQPEFVTDINPGGNAYPERFVKYNSKMYFQANHNTHGNEMWVTDGTAVGTNLVKDINPGTSGSQINGFIVFNGKIIFSANDGAHGLEMWESDGTDTGTKMVIDLNATTGMNPTQFFEFGNNRYANRKQNISKKY